ncbi:MAG: molecular chaperone DnaJ [Patescibacteria group bacterium]|nr:molecular chaperone DnaJ [Patescibacteria group bacterium]MDD5715299.1 molecular chaperone DnaJ [Patescibacteria group bacterium]
MAKDFYEILGVSRSASPDEIKRAYRTLAHQHHPDKAGGDEAKFKEINGAYQVLSNPDKRKQYDQFGQAFSGGAGGPGAGGFSWDDFARAQGGAGPFGGGFSQQGAEFDMNDLGDIFGDLFGFGRRTARGGRASRRGQDIQAEMTVEFREAAFGVDKIIDLYKQTVCPHCGGNGAEPGTKVETCPTCGGSGQVARVQRTILGSFQTAVPCPDCKGEGKRASKKCSVCRGEGRKKETEKLKVKIPAGISDGQVIRLSGKGEAGARGGAVGDLFLTIRVHKDPDFRREADDILSEANISFPQAALGAKIPVLTIDGEVILKIPAGTQSGKVFRLDSKGVPHLHSRGRGDHLVTVNVVTPEHLSHAQRELLERFTELE